MSALKDKLTESSKTAMRSGDKSRLAALRLILAAVKQQEVDTRKDLDDAAVQSVIAKMIKQGRDAAGQFTAAGRDDLAAKEMSEIAVFEEFMPEQLSDEEVAAAVADAIAATGATDVKSMGAVMGNLKARLAGRADMGTVSALVRARLSNG